jgi:hypothetical protein
MHRSDVAVDLFAGIGILGIGILGEIAVFIYNFLQIVNTVVAVLAVPKEIENSNVFFAVRAVYSCCERCGELTADVICSGKSARKIFCVVWNGLGNLFAV